MLIYTFIYTEEKMIKSRTIFIWDVHWCFNELKLLIKKLNIEENDTVYFTWDIINKWPKSYKVLNYIYKNKGQFKCIKWNNEVNFLKRLEINNIWDNNQTVSNNKTFNKLRDKIITKKNEHLISYIQELPLFIEEVNFLLIHGWLIPWKSASEHTEDEITRIREYWWELWYKQYYWDKKIIYWHNAIEWLQIRKNSIWLDSWCVYWRFLSAYILETGEVFSQNALNIYENVYKRDLSLIKKIKNFFK